MWKHKPLQLLLAQLRALPRALKLKNKASLDWEIQAGYPSLSVAGCDEVGRGCLAGAVCAAAVILPAGVNLDSLTEESAWLREIGDSKALSHQKRAELAPKIRSWAGAWAIGEASVEEIDRLNILRASHLAMIRAIAGLRIFPEHLLVDGKLLPDLKALERPLPATAIIKGDAKCLSIAAASILAKVYRDDAMVEWEKTYPGFGFAVHKGYPTPAHTEALSRLGVTPIHRRSFGPVARLLQTSSGNEPNLFSTTEQAAASTSSG